MNKTITMTTKGTFTMPVHIRKSMGVNTKGDTLVYTYDEAKKRITIEKPNVDLDALQKKMARFIKPGTLPLRNVDEFYQKNRIIT